MFQRERVVVVVVVVVVVAAAAAAAAACEAVLRKRPELWPNDWILHHDNAPAISKRF